MMLLFKKHILYYLLSTFLTLASADKHGFVSDVAAPSYYKYDAKPGQFPWVVSFKTVEHCMGTLVHPSWVLTAAHCLEQSSDPSYYVLQLGYVSSETKASGGQVETASQLHPYPRYRNSKTSRVRDHSNDIALVRVTNPFDPAPTLQMRRIPYVSDKYRRRPCHVLGFVKEVSDPHEDYRLLQYTRVYSYAFKDCYRKSRGQEDVGIMMRHTLCTSGIEKQVARACSGNPGGPLVCPVKNVKWRNSTQVEVVGVSSWNVPGVYCGAMARYTDVGYFRDWLKATINEESFVVPNRNKKDVKQRDDDTFPCSATTLTLCPRNCTLLFQLVSYYVIIFLMFSGTTNLTKQ